MGVRPSFGCRKFLLFFVLAKALFSQMQISFDHNLVTKSLISYDLSEVSTYGRFVLLFYQVRPGHEDEKPSSFRRRLSLGSVRFSSFIVKARLDMLSAYPSLVAAANQQEREDSEESFIPGSLSQNSSTVSPSSSPPSSQVGGGSRVAGSSRASGSRSVGVVRRTFWVVMVKFDTNVHGTERFSLAVEGYPFCLVKRNLNHAGPEWLELWQQWMQNASIPGSQFGYPVRVGGSTTAGLTRYRRQMKTAKTSGYFSSGAKEASVRRLAPIGAGEVSSDERDHSVRKSVGSSTVQSDGFRQQMSEHRLSQLEDRVRSLERLLGQVLK